MENTIVNDDVFGQEVVQEIDVPVTGLSNQENAISDSAEISPIESYFREIGFDNGIIKYGDREVHIDNLTSEEQLDVFIQASRNNSVENYLDDRELEFLGLARENKLTILELAERIAEERVQELASRYNMSQYQEVKDIDVSKLTPEQIIYQDTIDKLGDDATQEEIEKEYELELDRINSSSNKDKIVNNLRNKLQKNQDRYIQEQEYLQNQEYEAQLEEARRGIVNSVSQIESIAGFEVDDDSKNEILELMVEPHPNSEIGLPFLIEEYRTNPQIAYEAEWSRKNLPLVVDYYENQINALKNELVKAKTTAKAELFSGVPSKLTNIQQPTVKQQNKNVEVVRNDDIFG